MKHIVIIGATSAIAKECAKLWIKESPKNLTLVVRDINKAQRIKVDLQVRSPQSNIKIMETDFINSTEIEKTVSAITKQRSVDIVLIAHGSLPEQSDCQGDITLLKDTLEINGVSPVLFAECFAAVMEKTKQGTIAIISSVAGDRGRKSNYAYGAAKGLISRYAQGLQHRFANTSIKIVLVKPGPTNTPMTASLKEKGTQLAPVENVAMNIVSGIAKGKIVIYTPKKWQVVMLAIQHIPNIIFKKINI